ncbi:MAG: hypothetical protein ACJ72D_14070 [Marmoricola sp.]
MSATGAGNTYDEFVFTTGGELWDRLHTAHRRFAGLLSVTPHRTEIPGSSWNAGEVAGHLLTVLRRYTGGGVTEGIGLSPDGAGVAELNRSELADLAGTSVDAVLDHLWQELADLEVLFPRTMDLHQRYPFHGGQEMDGAAALGNLIGEFLIHGRDVARARGKIWKIGSRNAALALNVGMQVAPAYVARDGPGDLKVEIRTPETNSWVLDLADGALTSRLAEPGEPVDVRILGRAEPLLLNLYGRMSIATATLHGVTVIGGRRPWRLSRMARAFESP